MGHVDIDLDAQGTCTALGTRAERHLVNPGRVCFPWCFCPFDLDKPETVRSGTPLHAPLGSPHEHRHAAFFFVLVPFRTGRSVAGS